MRRRENTFRIEYANVPKKPSFEELHEFIGTVLGMTHEEVQRIQCSRTLGCAFVTANELSIAQKVVEQHDDKHDIECDGKLYRIRLKMEDGAVEVKLYDLPIDITDAQIVEFLRKYGEVLSIYEQVWGEGYRFGGYPTGVRIAKMVVKHNIPSYITLDGETTNVSYYGQQLTCRHCTEFVHSGISCIQNKKLLIQKLSTDQNVKSYANVARQSAGPRVATQTATKHANGSKQLGQKQAGGNQSSSGAEKPTSSSSWQVVGKKSTHLLSIPKHAGPGDTAGMQTTETLFKQPQNLGSQISLSGETSLPMPNRKHDGTETDDSTASSISKRTRRSTKKLRPDDHEAMDDDVQLL